MSELELKRLNELLEEIKLCGEIYNDKKWKNYKEYWRLRNKELKYETNEL
tara:strand:- start:483 stop:632 length:150 start_codon:yes stop_codon:yes gene_type:complete